MGLGTEGTLITRLLPLSLSVGVQTEPTRTFHHPNQTLELSFQTTKLVLLLKFNTGPSEEIQGGKRTY